MVTDRGEGTSTDINNKGQARLLGECTLDLSRFIDALTGISAKGVRQALKFVRTQNDG